MTNEDRQTCFYAQQELHRLLCEWSATSHDVKVAAIGDAIKALRLVPLPDDLQDHEPNG